LPTNLVGHTLGLLATRAMPERIAGPAASASLYRLRSSPLARTLAAIAIGNVILAETQFISGPRGRWVLAHELSHTRQHTWLGPFYLPVHFVFQIISALASVVRPVMNFPAQHAYNPLERLLLFVPFDVLVDGVRSSDQDRDRIWEAFGLSDRAG
jgi:hypothetical protein